MNTLLNLWLFLLILGCPVLLTGLLFELHSAHKRIDVLTLRISNIEKFLHK